MIKYAGYVREGTRQRNRVGDNSKAAVSKKIAIVAERRRAVLAAQADLTVAAASRHYRLEEAQGGAGAEGNDLDGKREGTEDRDLLRLIGNDHEPPGARGDDLLAHQG